MLDKVSSKVVPEPPGPKDATGMSGETLASGSVSGVMSGWGSATVWNDQIGELMTVGVVLEPLSGRTT